MQVVCSRPTGYQDGAFRLCIALTPAERALVEAAPQIAFAIPRLRRRAVYPDAGYQVAAPINGAVELRGILTRDGWYGDCYSNGVTEARNPTPVALVVQHLAASVDAALAVMREWADHASGRLR